MHCGLPLRILQVADLLLKLVDLFALLRFEATLSRGEVLGLPPGFQRIVFIIGLPLDLHGCYALLKFLVAARYAGMLRAEIYAFHGAARHRSVNA